MSDRVRRGDRPRGAVEPHKESGEARDCVVSRDEPGEAPPVPCSTSARVEVGEAEARPKGAFLEHPDPYMFESKLATWKAQHGGNNLFGK